MPKHLMTALSAHLTLTHTATGVRSREDVPVTWGGIVWYGTLSRSKTFDTKSKICTVFDTPFQRSRTILPPEISSRSKRDR